MTGHHLRSLNVIGSARLGNTRNGSNRIIVSSQTRWTYLAAFKAANPEPSGSTSAETLSRFFSLSSGLRDLSVAASSCSASSRLTQEAICSKVQTVVWEKAAKLSSPNSRTATCCHKEAKHTDGTIARPFPHQIHLKKRKCTEMKMLFFCIQYSLKMSLFLNCRLKQTLFV